MVPSHVTVDLRESSWAYYFLHPLSIRSADDRLLDIVHSDSKLYLVFEFLDCDLKKYMDTHGGKEGLAPGIVKVSHPQPVRATPIILHLSQNLPTPLVPYDPASAIHVLASSISLRSISFADYTEIQSPTIKRVVLLSRASCTTSWSKTPESLDQ